MNFLNQQSNSRASSIQDIEHLSNLKSSGFSPPARDQTLQRAFEGNHSPHTQLELSVFLRVAILVLRNSRHA